jgi:hypothetical protein
VQNDDFVLSGLNTAGRVFWRGKNLCCGIRAGHENWYRGLLNQRIIGELIERELLVDTRVADDSTDEFPLILRHRLVPTVSFAAEWCRSQLNAAALTVLDLEISVRQHELTLSDINPWNVLFDNIHPYFINFSSIVPINKTMGKQAWVGRQQFYEFYLNPLLLFHRGLSRVARRMLYDPCLGISTVEQQRLVGLAGSTLFREKAFQAAKQLAKTVLPASLHPAVGRVTRRFVSRVPDRVKFSADALPGIIALRGRVAALNGARVRRQKYYDDNFPEFTPSERWTAKHHSIFHILREAKPKTVLDIGSNRGWYAQLAAHSGARVIAADRDEASLNELYEDAKAARLSITPVIMDVRFPEPAQGPAYRMIPAASERFRSEMVFALAIVHHLVFRWHMNFEQICDTLAMFASKWLIVEFIGHEDAVVQRYGGMSCEPYRLDKFIATLSRHFDEIQQFPSDWGGLPYHDDSGDTACDRTILFCRRKTGPTS